MLNYNIFDDGEDDTFKGGTLPEVPIYAHKDPITDAYLNRFSSKSGAGFPGRFNNKQYNATWETWRENGNPNYRVNPNGYLPSHYNPLTNTITDANLPASPIEGNQKGLFSGDQITELAHARQAQDKGAANLSANYLRDFLKYMNNYQDMYGTSGAVEHDAHSVIEPKIKAEYKNKIESAKNYDIFDN